jgi:signal transduction histidine kinase
MPSRGSAEPEEIARIERVLAVGRLVLILSALVLVYWEPTKPPEYYRITFAVLLAYFSFSAGIFALLAVGKNTPQLPIYICVVDIVAAGLLMQFTQEPNSPFFLFRTFALVASAFRWGFLETVATGLGIALIYTAEDLLLAFRFGQAGFESTYEFPAFIVRSAYLLFVSILLGCLAHADKRQKGEKALVARAVGKAQAEVGLTETFEGVLGELVGFYAATGAVLAVVDKTTGGLYLAQYQPAEDAFQKTSIREISRDSLNDYLFPSRAHAWWSSHPLGGDFRTSAVDERGVSLRGLKIQFAHSFERAHPFESLLAVSVHFGEELSGRLFLLNPHLRASQEMEVRFMQTFARQTGPAIYNVYLWRRLRAKVGGIERAHIARDLHDGIVQVLVAMELHVRDLRNNATGEHNEFLREMQVTIQDEIQKLRELINRLRSVRLRPGELLLVLADLVERFGRETNTSARFSSDVEEVILPPRVCREIVAIVGEALANVRKHSLATRVLVRLNCHEGSWKLVIDDNGKGFDFSGELHLNELDARHKGPVTIKERVHLLKADLTIESRTGAGARLTISAPIRTA